MSRNLPSQVPQLEDEALVFLLLERATPGGCTVSPLCICWKAFLAERLATGGSSSIWVFLVVVVTLPQGDLPCISRKKVVLVNSGEMKVLHCLWCGCAIGVGRGKELNLGRKRSHGVPVQAFCFL